ncbi:MAG: DUF1015 domain-containing protein [Thermoplasmata archaeon]
MAHVVPFEAVRYNTSRFGRDLTRFVAPPYDVIDPSLEKALKQDRLNITYITLGDRGDGYALAAQRLRTWLCDKVLVRDEGKCFYMYEQTFAGPDGRPRVRWGLVGLIRLEDFESGVIMPHERTIPKHRADRLALLRAVKGNMEQVFMLYSDPSGEIDSLLREARTREEELRFVDHDGVGHRIVRLAEPSTVQHITDRFTDIPLLIADGHHRYETALEYRDMMRSLEGKSGEKPYDFILGTMVSSANPGLIVFPTHRLVRAVDERLLADLPRRLEEEFVLSSFETPDELASAVETAEGAAFGVWVPSSNTMLLATRKHKTLAGNPMEDLPVYIVQEMVLKRLLGYTDQMLDSKVNIEYVKGTGPAKDAMSTDQYQACFFLKPPTVAQVMAVARTGQKLPHKSTYFYPKIWSGALMYLF